MIQRLALALLFITCAVGAAPTQKDAARLMQDFQRSAEQKQPWLVPDPTREFAGDFVARLRKEADGGSTKAQATLGLCHQLGLGVKRDPAKAMEWYKKAAASGHAGAQNNLGLLYDEGAAGPRDPRKAHELYLSAAQADFADAEFNLGLNYATGTVVGQDWREAAAWYEKAAAQGHRAALNNLGNIYFLGRGVPADVAKAREYLRRPAEAGLAVSQLPYGVALLMDGKLEEGTAWVRRSAEGGYPGGQFVWAQALFEGHGVERDPKEALKWARLAAEKVPAILPAKAAEAQALVAQILLDDRGGVPPAPDEACRRARQAAEQGNARGQFILGICYHRGAGVARDVATAIKWYRLSAAQQDPDAAINLASLLETGEGTARDFAEAVKWYRLAAAAGNGRAQYRLGLCYRDGTGVDIDLGEAATWLRRAVQATGDREAKDALAEAERQLAHAPAETEFRQSLELGQKAEAGADTWKEAIGHLRKAAELGHPYAPAVLAGMYRRGKIAPPDDAAAEALIAKIEVTSDPVLLHCIGMSYVLEHDVIPAKYLARAVGFLRRAALQGYPPSQNTLGFELMSVAGGPADLVEAFKWLTLSAKQGDPTAKVNLTRLLPMLNAAQIEEGTNAADSFVPRREEAGGSR